MTRRQRADRLFLLTLQRAFHQMTGFRSQPADGAHAARDADQQPCSSSLLTSRRMVIWDTPRISVSSLMLPPHAAPPWLKYADVVLLESPLSLTIFHTSVTTRATALATPGVVIALCRCFYAILGQESPLCLFPPVNFYIHVGYS